MKLGGILKKSSILHIQKRHLFSLIALLSLTIFLLIGIKYVFNIRPRAAGGLCKFLIAMDRDGTIYPDDLALDLERIERSSNLPYNGIVFRIPPTETVSPETMMKPGIVLDAATIDRELAPLRDLSYKPTKLKHNFIRVLVRNADFYDDANWNRIAENFKVLADGLDRLRDSGFGVDGIAFDNEGPYGASCSFWDWYVGNPCLPEATSDSTFRPYQDKSRLRGKEVMDRMIQNSSFKDMRILTYLDSYFSCDNNSQHSYDNFWLGYELMGSFTLGLLESTVGTDAKVIDGGEYSYYVDNTNGHTFPNRYNYRKNMMPSDPACSFMTRAESGSSTYPNFALDNDQNGVKDWTQYLSVAQGLMKGYAAALFTNIQTSMRDTLNYSDDYVWFYTEHINSIDPLNANAADPAAVWINSDGNDWNNEIWLGRQAVPNDPSCDNPGTCTAPSSPTSFTAIKNSTNPTTAIDLAWVDNTASDHTGFKIWYAKSTDSYPASPNFTINNAATRTQAVTGLEAGTTYKFKIDAYKDTCDSAVAETQATTDPVVCTAPASPTAFSAVKNPTNPTGAIDLTWTDTTADHDGFWIWRSTTPGSFSPNPTITLPDVNMRSYTNTTGILPDTTYYYRLESYKGTCFSSPIETQVKTDPVGILLNLTIELQGRTDYSTTNTHLRIYDSNSALILDKTDVATDATGKATITLPSSMTVGSTYSFFTKPKYFLGDYKGGQVLTNPMILTYAIFKGADLDDNNIVNSLDFSYLTGKWGQNDPIADINKDGIVNTIDFSIMSSNWLLGS